MDANEFAPDPRIGHVDLAAASALSNPPSRRRLRCGDVARNRAARYARRHRIPKPFWPLMTTLILIGLIFERRAAPVLPSSNRSIRTDDTITASPSEMPDVGGDIYGTTAPRDTGGATRGQHALHYRPSHRVLAKYVGQIVAFLIRNRGRVDNEAVRAKWGILDRISLPLAVYLREIEANSAWDDLEKEISAAPFGAPAVSGMDIPKSARHRKILRVLPEWVGRGDELLSGDLSPGHDPKLVPTLDEDGGPDTKPRRP